MKNNVSTADRIIRILFAIVVAILAFTGIISGTISIVLIALAVVFAITAFISFCPIFYVLGISTKPKQKS